MSITFLLFLFSFHSVDGSRSISQSLLSLGGLPRRRLLPLSPPALPTSLLLDVGLDVEVGEETYEGEGVANQGVVHPLGEVTVDVERVDSVDYRKTELKLGRYEKCVCVCVCV